MRFEMLWLSTPSAFRASKAPLVFLVEEVPNLFQDGDGVGFLFGVLAKFDQHVKQLVHVGEVEVAATTKLRVRQLFWRRRSDNFQSHSCQRFRSAGDPRRVPR